MVIAIGAVEVIVQETVAVAERIVAVVVDYVLFVVGAVVVVV